MIKYWTKLYLCFSIITWKRINFEEHVNIAWVNITLCEKHPNTELFLVRIFLYSDWIRRFTSKSPFIQFEYRKIWTRNNSAFGHFSRSVICENKKRIFLLSLNVFCIILRKPFYIQSFFMQLFFCSFFWDGNS